MPEPTALPERIKRLSVEVSGQADAQGRAGVAGELLHESTYHFTYASDTPHQPAVSLLMPARQARYEDGDLFPVMEMNLPEGFLFQQLVERFRKQRLTKMHLLALMGCNGIGRLGFALPHSRPPAPQVAVSRQDLLKADPQQRRFTELVHAYLANGAGISGVQPKIMLPSRATVPTPDLIVKAAGASFPSLAANEFLCLSAARAAGLAVPTFDLSDDAGLLVIDRFDLAATAQDTEGPRRGFEDMAALMGLRVHDRLSNRKYQGSYDRVAQVIALLSSDPSTDLAQFYEQLALSVMVRNGDAHLKNFGLLYADEQHARLSPLFDVVTTSIYRFERPGGFEDVDRTLALKWRSGKHASRSYPDTTELLSFGRDVCRVPKPEQVIARIAEAMQATLNAAQRDPRIPAPLLADMAEQWSLGMAHARLR